MKKFTMLFSLLVIFIGVQEVNAQKTVFGWVTRASDYDAPLAGATILVKGTTIETTTDENGYYEIEVPNDECVLVFKFVGMNSNEIEVGSQNVINVALEPDINSSNTTAQNVPDNSASKSDSNLNISKISIIILVVIIGAVLIILFNRKNKKSIKKDQINYNSPSLKEEDENKIRSTTQTIKEESPIKPKDGAGIR